MSPRTSSGRSSIGAAIGVPRPDATLPPRNLWPPVAAAASLEVAACAAATAAASVGVARLVARTFAARLQQPGPAVGSSRCNGGFRKRWGEGRRGRGRWSSAQEKAWVRRATEGANGPLGVAERYSSYDWWLHILDFPFSRVLYRIFPQLSFVFIVGLSVYGIQETSHSFMQIPPTPLTLSSAALGLLLVFRTTAAYERWQLGQQRTYELRHHLQQVLRSARPWLPEEIFDRLQAQVRAMPLSIATHLAAKPGAGFIYGVGPRDLITQVSEDMALVMGQPNVRGAVAGFALERVHTHLDKALLCVADMERLATEAVPRDYSRHTSRFLTVWMVTLPFVLLDCGALMPVAVTVIAWALLSIEEIGHTLEDPFNSPTQPVNVRSILEYGGGEHTLAPGYQRAPPPARSRWERSRLAE
eukprot:CAMPEP_0170569230 /NCGR_PEP_ID=MMETSP0224-20130122/423_1 /TAXON_ID=285029 /ORGANISM="Togula jolla, Strain CCCM 725" /LENGTH=414 /DNA_ID=CAMNT_0010891341 /DNA_START=1 /DNA_END=1242 /DNA_ORIENTATION=-